MQFFEFLLLAPDRVIFCDPRVHHIDFLNLAEARIFFSSIPNHVPHQLLKTQKKLIEELARQPQRRPWSHKWVVTQEPAAPALWAVLANLKPTRSHINSSCYASYGKSGVLQGDVSGAVHCTASKPCQLWDEARLACEQLSACTGFSKWPDRLYRVHSGQARVRLEGAVEGMSFLKEGPGCTTR